ncbi:hypothetical protein ACVXHB_20240 [Escherichia coli]
MAVKHANPAHQLLANMELDEYINLEARVWGVWCCWIYLQLAKRTSSMKTPKT